MQDVPQVIVAQRNLFADLMTIPIEPFLQSPIYWIAILAAGFGFVALRDFAKTATAIFLLLSIGAAIDALIRFKTGLDG